MACRLDGAKPLSEQCWNIINSTFGNTIQWNLKRNSSVFIEENAREHVVCEKAAILSQPQCVNSEKTSLPMTRPFGIHFKYFPETV